LIEIKDLYYTYPTGVSAINGVDLKINSGEFVAIMGENGAGKTTLVKHFNGLLKPTKGAVIVDNVDTRSVSVAKLSRKVGLIFQNPEDQFFCETVKDELAYGPKNFGFNEDEITKKVKWALDFMGISEYADTSPFALSGGEKKRVAIASVLVWDPEIIVLDEPTIGQDYRQKVKLRNFLLDLKRKGKAVIIVTHDVEFVAECSPRVILMSKGKIIADGSAKKILTDYSTLIKASILPPQITQVFMEFKSQKIPRDVIDVREAKEVLASLLRRTKA
jgi:energy-coupling factor transport system ATP-binding protein